MTKKKETLEEKINILQDKTDCLNYVKDTELTGNISTDSDITDKRFLKELEKLMEKHKINKVDVCWARFKST